jgi:hypothetical protein
VGGVSSGRGDLSSEGEEEKDTPKSQPEVIEVQDSRLAQEASNSPEELLRPGAAQFLAVPIFRDFSQRV